jgi:hypothetical protein
MIDGVQRWLIPHPDGPEAALVRVRSTTPTDDWLALQVSMQGPTKAERNQVRAHFLGLDDPELSAKVLEVCGAPEPQADEGA